MTKIILGFFIGGVFVFFVSNRKNSLPIRHNVSEKVANSESFVEDTSLESDEVTWPVNPLLLQNKHYQASYNPLLPSIDSVQTKNNGIAEVTISYPKTSGDPKFFFEKKSDCAETTPAQCAFVLNWDKALAFNSNTRNQVRFSVNLKEVTGYDRDVSVTLEGPQNKITARY